MEAVEAVVCGSIAPFVSSLFVRIRGVRACMLMNAHPLERVHEFTALNGVVVGGRRSRGALELP